MVICGGDDNLQATNKTNDQSYLKSSWNSVSLRYRRSVLSLTLSQLKRPKAAIKDPGTCPACDVINFYPERRHLCSNCEAGPDLSNDT